MLQLLLGPRQINFEKFFLKALMEGAWHREYSKSFHPVKVAGKFFFQRIYISPLLLGFL